MLRFQVSSREGERDEVLDGFWAFVAIAKDVYMRSRGTVNFNPWMDFGHI